MPLARFKGKRKDRWTPERVKCRSYFQIATRAWGTLTAAQCVAWQDYARTWFRIDANGRRTSVAALNVFIKANVIRQLMKLPMVTDAPLLGPPSPPNDVTLEPSAAPDEFRFRVHHGFETLAGYSLLVRVTPATQGPGRAPEVANARYVCGIGPQSAAPLPPTGETVTFPGAPVAVADGKRMAFEVRILRNCDGMASQPLWRDVVRQVG